MSSTENERLFIISVYLCEMFLSVNYLTAIILSHVCLQTRSITGVIHGIK